jgi:putative Mg2+ transporter-C (MgtC) family protein
MSPDALFATAGEDLFTLAQAIVALVLGGAIGWEREAAGKLAGLRTNMLVCLVAFLFTKIGLIATGVASDALNADLVEADPVRIVQAIVVGLSFLGTGVIFREPHGDRVHGLTTAATLLTVAPIGIALALDRYVLAVGVTILVLVVLRFVHRVEDRYFPQR